MFLLIFALVMFAHYTLGVTSVFSLIWRSFLVSLMLVLVGRCLI